MSIGRYISLEEARKHKKLDRFAKEHPSKGDKDKFDKLMDKMAPPPKKRPKASKTSRKG